MADYISREALLHDIEKYRVDSSGKFRHWVEIQPTADVKPVRFTVAIPSETVTDYYGTWGECQSCGYDDNTVSAKYCGGCGARLFWRANNGD